MSVPSLNILLTKCMEHKTYLPVVGGCYINVTTNNIKRKIVMAPGISNFHSGKNMTCGPLRQATTIFKPSYHKDAGGSQRGLG